ncbi:MAG: ABC transporter permease [Candidatus Asgardarchaeum sp.]
MNFQNVKIIVIRIFRQLRRDKRTLGLMIIGPILVTFLFSYAFAGEVKNVPVAIANQDESFEDILASVIIDEMRKNESFNINEIRDLNVNWSEFGKSIQTIIIFPENFTRNLLIGENVTLQVWINVSLQYYATLISNFISSAVNDVMQDYFGAIGISFDFNTTIQQHILPPVDMDQKLNITIVNLDSSFEIVFGDLIVSKLASDDDVSVSIVKTREDCIDAIKKRKSIVSLWIPSNFTKSLLLRNGSVTEIFINGIERDEVSVALKSIQNAISDSISEILNISSYEITKNYIYGSEDLLMIDLIGPSVMGFISMFFAFIISGVFFLRERLQGTLERMLASPLMKTEIIFGYLIAFLIVATIQSTLVVLTIIFFSTRIISSLLFIYILVLLCTMGSVSLAIFISSFMKTELQVIQMIPIYIVPQIFLSGMFISLRVLPEVLVPIAYVFPLTYYVSAAKAIAFMNASLTDVWLELSVLIGYFILGLILSIKGFRKTVA